MLDVAAAAKKAYDGAVASGLNEDEAWDIVATAVIAATEVGSGMRLDSDPPPGDDGSVGN